MTSEELILILSTLPPDTRVCVKGYEGGFDDILPENLEFKEVLINENVWSEEDEKEVPQRWGVHPEKGTKKHQWQGHHEEVKNVREDQRQYFKHQRVYVLGRD